MRKVSFSIDVAGMVLFALAFMVALDGGVSALGLAGMVCAVVGFGFSAYITSGRAGWAGRYAPAMFFMSVFAFAAAALLIAWLIL